MRYVLGIDTTAFASCVGLVDDKGNVLSNEKIDIDFEDQNAKTFYNFHNQNVLTLAKPILERYEKDIFLISASSEDGPFHSMPVGAVVANSLSYFWNKNIVGVSHSMAHMHAIWLDRDKKKFSFPIISLVVSGGHSDIYLIRNLGEAEKISEIIWRDDSEKFGGLGALFDVICHFLKIRIKKGGGGLCFERMAGLGEPKFRKELEHFSIRKKNGNFYFGNLESSIPEALKSLGYYHLHNGSLEKFQKDFAASLSEILFDSLVEAVAQTAKETGAREIHLTGGVALDKTLNSKMAAYCQNNNFNYKFPLKPEYCRDNAAMTAISGYFKWKYSDYDRNRRFLVIKPSEWYSRYYAKYFSK